MTCPMSPIERKVDYTFCVNFIMSYSGYAKQAFAPLQLTIKPFLFNNLRHFLLDNFLVSGIIRLTGKMSYSGDRYHGRLWRCKIGSTWPKWHIEYSSGGCYRRSILRQRVFRPSRYVASQVRDASTGAARWTARFKSDKNVRFFSCFILPDTTCLRPTRISWPNASSARPSACPQINQRCHGIYYGLQKQKIISSGSGFSNPHKAAFWLKRTSPQYRTSTATSGKKKAVNLSEPDECLDYCADRYEQLRQMILEGKDYCCQGWGLALLIHRGFLAWVDALSKIESYQQQSVVPAISVPDKTNLAIPDTIRGRMIMTISDMVLSTLQGVAL